MQNPFKYLSLSIGNVMALATGTILFIGALAVGQVEILNNKADIKTLTIGLEKNDDVDQELVGRFIRIETNQNHMLELLKDLKNDG